MARGGINKALVKQARDAVLARGENPSIDTVRIELGNTGSKTTIHRYLKELEEQEAARLDDEALLSNTLKEMVANIAARLYEEANLIVEEAQKHHKNQQAEWKARHDQQAQALAEAEQRITDLQRHQAESEMIRLEVTEAHQAASAEAQRLAQQVADLDALIEEKNGHIQSLEEKHRHSREVLEHYRQSVKDQREQDRHRHDRQIQQLQAEQRQLNQTLSVKQSDITQLNKDNARLATEVAETRKQLATSESKMKDLETRLKTAEDNAASAIIKLRDQQAANKQQVEAVATLELKLANSEEQNHSLDIELAKLKAELDVKNQVFEKMGLSD